MHRSTRKQLTLPLLSHLSRPAHLQLLPPVTITHPHQVIVQASHPNIPGTLEKIDLTDGSPKIPSRRRTKTHITHMNLNIVQIPRFLQIVTNLNVKLRIVKLKLLSILHNVLKSRIVSTRNTLRFKIYGLGSNPLWLLIDFRKRFQLWLGRL